MREIQCQRCGKPTIAKTHNAIYCPDCRREADKARSCKWYANNKKKKPDATDSTSIVQAAIEARQHGMTYGQYVAMMEG